MIAKYIIRLDDACPTMHKANWEGLLNLGHHCPWIIDIKRIRKNES